MTTAGESQGRPNTIGRFQVDGVLGRGGMGVVYKAYDPTLERTVAVKTIATTADSAALTERLLREAKACAKLSHPGIVVIHDAGETGGVFFIAMEYLQGENLCALIEKGTISFDDKLRFLALALDALHYAHERGVVHRDIKPSNIMIVQDAPKLVDFGLARTMQADTMTLSGQVVGTPHYMAPEQMKGRAIDRRTDVYALGIVAYELITRRRAFDGASITDVMLKVMTEDAPPMSTDWAAAVPGIEAIIRRAIRKDPAERYQSAREMQAAIDELRSRHSGRFAAIQDTIERETRKAILEAETLIRSGRPGEAASKLKTTIARDPDDLDAKTLLLAQPSAIAPPSAVAAAAAAAAAAGGVGRQKAAEATAPGDSLSVVNPTQLGAATVPGSRTRGNERTSRNRTRLRIAAAILIPVVGLFAIHAVITERRSRADSGRIDHTSAAIHEQAAGSEKKQVPPPSAETSPEKTVRVAALPPVDARLAQPQPANRQLVKPQRKSVYVSVDAETLANENEARRLIALLRAELGQQGMTVTKSTPAEAVLRLGGSITTRPSTFATSGAVTADYVATARLEIGGRVETRHFDGHSLEFGELTARDAALKALAERLSGFLAEFVK